MTHPIWNGLIILSVQNKEWTTKYLQAATVLEDRKIFIIKKPLPNNKTVLKYISQSRYFSLFITGKLYVYDLKGATEQILESRKEYKELEEKQLDNLKC